MVLPHSSVDTPVFMPVGTQGTMKGLTPEQLGTSHNSSFLKTRAGNHKKAEFRAAKNSRFFPVKLAPPPTTTFYNTTFKVENIN
jgi:hypothetical protein